MPDKLAGLGGGADDYMVKPFRFDELLARIPLRLRDGQAETPNGSVLRCGGLVLDLDTRLATVDGETVELSAREFSLASVLLRNSGHVLTREQLLDRVWGFDFDPAPTASTSTSATCARRSAPNASRPFAASATDSSRRDRVPGLCAGGAGTRGGGRHRRRGLHGTTLRDEPGIGHIAAATLLVEVGDPHRFATEARFARWCGTGRAPSLWPRQPPRSWSMSASTPRT